VVYRIMAVQIVYPSEKYLPSFYDALTMVAKERVYLEMIEPPPFEKVAAFQKGLVEKNGPVYYAIDGDKVVGWCDAFPENSPRQSHRGTIGMGILSEYRGQGIGTQLMNAVIAHAKKFGLEKLELNVYTSNVHAHALYKKLGFEQEGLIKKYRKLDGQYFDCITMAKFL
jgi:RimJ/RimL family protein N-acetyltransferase